MDPLRILHLDTERTWRGGERQALWLARELQRRGHENWIACRPGSPLHRNARAAGLPTLGVRPWLAEAALFSAFRLRTFMRENGIGILHAHTGHAVGLGALAVGGTGTKFAATRRVDFALNSHAASRWKYGRLDLLVPISAEIRRVLLEGGMPADRVAAPIPSGIDPASYPSAADRSRLRRGKGFSDRDVLAVNAAALVPHKDQRTLLEAVPAVLRGAPEIQFLILGEGPLRNDLLEAARRLGIEKNVRLLGHRPDVLEYIAMADVFVFSSAMEGLGTSLLDAMAVGVPTVATRAGGIPELYGGPDAPELVPPRDPAALARGILSVLKEPEEARRRVERGRERLSGFTVRAMADRYEAAYRRLLDGKWPRPD